MSVQNRKERRKRKNKQHIPTYNYTKEQLDAYAAKRVASVINNIREDLYKDVEDKIFEALLGLPILVLHDKFGFGRKRLGRFIQHVMRNIDYLDEGYYTHADLRKTLFDEVGVEISNGTIYAMTSEEKRARIKELDEQKQEDAL